jgi:hypothetical protein
MAVEVAAEAAAEVAVVVATVVLMWWVDGSGEEGTQESRMDNGVRELVARPHAPPGTL